MSGEAAAGAPAPVAEAAAVKSVSINVIWAVVLSGTIFVAAGAAGLFLWLSRRRANRHRLPDLTGEGAIHSATCQDNSGPKKLQRLAWSTAKSRVVSTASSLSSSSSYLLLARRHRSMPILRRFSRELAGRFSVMSSLSRRSSGPPKPALNIRHKRNPSWIDEDAIHGPVTSCKDLPEAGLTSKGKGRESWPMQYRSPTLPRLCHSLYGGAYNQRWQEQVEKETMTGAFGGPYSSSPDSYTQVVMEARSLPEPPQLAVVAGRDRYHAPPLPPTVRLGLWYSNSEPPMRPKGSLNTSPVRYSLRTPSRQWNRQSSTDSTLSEILRSTEQRLQEGYVSTARLPRRSRTSAAPGKPQWFGTGRESLLDHGRQYGMTELPAAVHRSRSEAKAYSPKKITIVENGGHSRQESQTSTLSSNSTIDLGVLTDSTSGMATCNRNPAMQETDTQFLGLQSVRSSLSSALSTIQSEDEIPESINAALSPLSSPNTTRVGGTNSIISTSNMQTTDPFSNATWNSALYRPATSQVYPTRTQKPPDLFRESLERSLRSSILRATVDQSTLLAQASRLPPLPAAPGGGRPHSLFRADCPGCCKLGQTKTIPVQTRVGGSIPGSPAVELPALSRGELVAPPPRGPKGPRTLQPTKVVSVLNSAVLPPPVSAPSFAGIRGQVGEDLSQVATNQVPRLLEDNRKRRGGSRSPSDRDRSPPSPTHRPSSRASKIQRRTSVSSSVYSQDQVKEHPTAPNLNSNAYANKMSYQANSRTETTPNVPFQAVFRGIKSSENIKLPRFTGFASPPKEKGAAAGDTENRNGSQPPSALGFGIASTVAELRRMNSGISLATSAASSDAGGGYASGNRPITPTSTARLSVIGKSGHGRSKSGGGSGSGRKAYLSLGGTTPTSLQKNSSGTALRTSPSGSPISRRRSGLVPPSVSVPATVMALESGMSADTTTAASGSPIKKKIKTAGGHVSGDTRSPQESPSKLLGSQPWHQDKCRFDEKGRGDIGGEDGDGENENNNNNNNCNPHHDNVSNLKPHKDSYSPNTGGFTSQASKPQQPAPPPTSVFKFPPVTPQNFTFEVRPLSLPNKSSSTTTTRNSANTKRHRRHNTPQWGQTITIARLRDRTPSPHKPPPPIKSQPPCQPLPALSIPPLTLKSNPNTTTTSSSSSHPSPSPKTPQPITPKSPRRQQHAPQRQHHPPIFELVGLLLPKRGVVSGGVKSSPAPELATAGSRESPARRSIESLGLYDQDGFLISNSPVRPLSPAKVGCR